ncbi:hypothetical protein BKA70DRAFT_1265634 [Coprinopsis sp. MPI-PUGE-AT-0042]|nr:hypothetical protein BKA70DRAFT_1265634 [Coprinopsis sp. MPI-PUGE-AT-0042]
MRSAWCSSLPLVSLPADLGVELNALATFKLASHCTAVLRLSPCVRHVHPFHWTASLAHIALLCSNVHFRTFVIVCLWALTSTSGSM